MPAILDPLRERDLALLFSAKAVSVAGDGIYVVALAWQVYALSNVPAALATVGLALSVPQVALFLLGGVLADRFERRRVLLVADGVRAVALTTLGALALSGALELWHVVVLVAFVGAGDALFYPAFSALLPELASGERLARANALDQLTRTVALRLVGPVLGGALVAGVGAGPAFVLDGLSFALSLLALSRIRRRPAPAAGHARRSVRTELAEGVRYVRGEAWLACTLALAALSLLLFWGPFEVLLPYVIRNDLGGGAGDFGAVLAAGGAGAVVATLWLGQRGQPRRRMAACYLAWGLMLSSLVGYGLVTATWQAAAVYAVAYGLNAIAVVIFSTKVQESVPRELLGRVSSLDWVTSYALIPLSFALTGPVAGLIGARATLVGAGALGLAATAAMWFGVPALRATDGASASPAGLPGAQRRRRYARTRAGNPGSTAIASGGACAPGGNSASTEPPNPPPIIRAPAAPASSIRSRACSTAGTEAS
jgi:DHA3 family tetracycline resistance protein-like MFS transporter